MAHDPWSSLRFPEYRSFLLSMGTVFVATQVQSTVLGYQVYELTHDAFKLGLVGLAEALPFLALTLFGGWLADRRDRRAISLWSLAAVAISGVTLLAVTALGVRSVVPLYAAQALAGAGRAFYRPASSALGTELVPRERYHNAATWRSSVLQSSMVLGPALGGGLIAVTGPWLGYAAVVVLSVIGLIALARVHARPRSRGGAERIGSALREGIGFVFAQPVLLGAMSLDLFAVLFGGAIGVLPAFARDVLGVGAAGFGVLRAAPAFGSVMMSLVMARLGELRRAGPVLLWAVAFFGTTWIGFAVSRWFALSVALLALGGMLDNVSVVLRNTLVQVWTPQDKMGRVSAVSGFFIGSSNELGTFESGVAARLMGLVPSVVFGGVMTLLTVGAVAWRVPALRRLGRIRPDESLVDETASGP